ncbi:hypothetical protein AVEN_76596-1 [Araneus ventricosus]|uniref:Tesmin/TSO1-like CXC domain-containing protein n=1 Tax=Araneus ventricosus TaxID=182803 RepID=A0A4Y2MGE3_ARAVE|nr:hypothetical protein AVEN_76596-1 [Araneus ventricosus]
MKPHVQKEQFLANERNKVRFIDLMKKFLQKANVTIKQAVEDTDVLIVETALSVKSQYDNIFVVEEDIDFLVLLTVLAPMKENLYFRKCGKGRTPDVLYSTTSFKYKFSRMIWFIQDFSGCDTRSALFGYGETKFCSLLEKKTDTWKKKYKGNPRTSACDLNHLCYALFTQSATKARSTLACLPPTVDAARFHALRSYLQIQKWLGHERNPLDESCQKECKNACGCRKTGLICSSLCTCSLGEACENVSDINLLEDGIEDEDDTPSSINIFIYEDIEDLYLQLDEENKEQQTELEDFRPGPTKRQKL